MKKLIFIFGLSLLFNNNVYSANNEILLEKKAENISISYTCNSDGALSDINSKQKFGITYETLIGDLLSNMVWHPYNFDREIYSNASFFLVQKNNKLSFFFPNFYGYLVQYEFHLNEYDIFSEKNKKIILERTYMKPPNQTGMEALKKAISIRNNISSLKNPAEIKNQMLKLFDKTMVVMDTITEIAKSTKVTCNRNFINK